MSGWIGEWMGRRVKIKNDVLVAHVASPLIVLNWVLKLFHSGGGGS